MRWSGLIFERKVMREKEKGGEGWWAGMVRHESVGFLDFHCLTTCETFEVTGGLALGVDCSSSF